ncbi:MAG: hypothetical protein AB7P37_02030 [Ramlibacter sp.]
MSLYVRPTNDTPPTAYGGPPAAPKPSAHPAAAPGADVMKQLDEATEALSTLLTGVDNQPTVQTQLQVQATVQEVRILPELQATLNKQYREAQEATIAKV